MNYTIYHPYKEREGGGQVKKFRDREGERELDSRKHSKKNKIIL